jgi:hypothetical protein
MFVVLLAAFFGIREVGRIISRLQILADGCIRHI